MREKLVYLVQTDTTVGFASQDAQKLEQLKGRPLGKQFLRTLGSFRELDRECRVRKIMRKRVRASKKTTFVYGDGIARRVVAEGAYRTFLKRFGWSFSTSANKSGRLFDREWAEGVSDAVVYDPEGFCETSASSIYKLGKTRVKKLR